MREGYWCRQAILLKHQQRKESIVLASKVRQLGAAGGVQAGHDSGTILAYGTGPMPGGTMVVNADASSSRSGTLGPAGTFVTAGVEAGPQGGSDYQAAVQAASQGADG